MTGEAQAIELNKTISRSATTSRRIDYVDIAKGIGIVLAVMGHNDLALISPLRSQIDLFIPYADVLFHVRNVLQD